MKTLLRGATVVNVFTGELEKANVLLEDSRIAGVGDYTASDADTVEDVTGKFVCPGFIDGHIHIESTMLTPAELTKLCMPHGTTAIVADPHEIANVCGVDGIRYMMQASEGLPMQVYFALPSCVPATPFDESGAELYAKDIDPLYDDHRVVGLAEMMNYPGVLYGDPAVADKIAGALKHGKCVDGHAPFLSGKELDRYIGAGIQSDHECSGLDEALEKLRKGQWIMVRQGTAARNLHDLIGLFACVGNDGVAVQIPLFHLLPHLRRLGVLPLHLRRRGRFLFADQRFKLLFLPLQLCGGFLFLCLKLRRGLFFLRLKLCGSLLFLRLKLSGELLPGLIQLASGLCKLLLAGRELTLLLPLIPVERINLAAQVSALIGPVLNFGLVAAIHDDHHDNQQNNQRTGRRGQPRHTRNRAVQQIKQFIHVQIPPSSCSYRFSISRFSSEHNHHIRSTL